MEEFFSTCQLILEMPGHAHCDDARCWDYTQGIVDGYSSGHQKEVPRCCAIVIVPAKIHRWKLSFFSDRITVTKKT